MSFVIKEGITWVGKTDWEIRRFHGEEYSTHKGTTYNSYLVQDEKTVLIDTVWHPFADEFVENLKQVIDLNEIDYIVANHAELDHSGSLAALLKEIPGTPVYCTRSGIASLKGHFHQDWNFVEVKTGDKLSLGSKELVFIEAKMLHWPDSMFCYLTEDAILFSNDAFGQHYASEYMYNDLVNQAELFAEALKYYANILTPFSKLVEAKIKEVVAFNLPVEMICPSHGVIWRQDPLQIVNRYLEWAGAYQENLITLVYDTMWDGTRKAAEAIAAGIISENPAVNVKLYNCARSDINDIVTEIFKSHTLVLGSPTINKGILHSVAALLEMVKGLQFKNKKAAAFGCYGWSGESVEVISRGLAEAGFSVVGAGLKLLWNPDQDALARAREFGQEIARTMAG